MKKKLISMMLVSVLAVSCLAGCGNSGGESASNDNGGTPAVDSSADAGGG